MSHGRVIPFLFFLLLPALLAGAPAELVSVDDKGIQGDLASCCARVTPDGRFVLFTSAATNLSPADTNSQRGVFRRDLRTQKTILIGKDFGVAADISDDGQIVAFESKATDLVNLPDVVGSSDIFVRDVRKAQTRLVSVNWPGNAAGNGESFSPRITPNGRYVLFESDADDLVKDDTNEKRDVFVRDLQKSMTILVSAGPTGASANGKSDHASITPDGRYVFFESEATDLVASGQPGIYRRDLVDNTTEIYRRDLVDNTTLLVAENSFNASVSDDGQHVTFTTKESKVALDTNKTADIYYVVMLANGDKSRPLIVSAFSLGPAAGSSEVSVISANGSFVAFESDAPLSSEDDNGQQDVYVRSLVTGAVTLVSAAAGGGSGQGKSRLGGDRDPLLRRILSDDGRYVVFESTAGDLVIPAVTGGARQVFLRDRLTNTTRLLSRAERGGQGGNSDSSGASIAADIVVFDSEASDLVTNDLNGTRDVFVTTLLRERAVVTAQALSFGAVPVGGFSQQIVTLTNAGEATLLVRDLTITGLDSFGFSLLGGAGDFSLAAGESQPLTVSFTPPAAGPQRAALRIESSDPESPLYVDLTGVGLSPGGPNVFASKEAVGALVAGTELTYVIRIVNAGAGDQPDNVGNEFLDVLPSSLVLLGATASSGTLIVDIATGAVAWSGSIAAASPGNLPEVLLSIRARIPSGLATGTLITNQGSVFYDADGNAANGNEATRLTDDPAASGAASSTSFQVGSVADIPVLAPLGLMALALLLAGAALAILRFSS